MMRWGAVLSIKYTILDRQNTTHCHVNSLVANSSERRTVTVAAVSSETAIAAQTTAAEVAVAIITNDANATI